jgi:hypothetical protein
MVCRGLLPQKLEEVRMKRLYPLRRAVVFITNEASPDDQKGIKKAIKSWHNKLAIGSIPREVITKLGRELYLDLDQWEAWLESRTEEGSRRPGRPRSSGDA